MGQFSIVMPAVSYARELWRFGEPELATRAALLTPGECLDLGDRAGALVLSGQAKSAWPQGPHEHASGPLLAAIEHFEGALRPCSRNRRLPEKALPNEWQLSEEQRWEAHQAITDEQMKRLTS